jgi:hypothetical protein
LGAAGANRKERGSAVIEAIPFPYTPDSTAALTGNTSGRPAVDTQASDQPAKFNNRSCPLVEEAQVTLNAYSGLIEEHTAP